MPSLLFGHYHVTPTPTAMKEAHDLFKNYGDYQEARKHALKLAFWPMEHTERSGQVIDLDWDEIVAMPSPRAFELRIDDVIGGHDKPPNHLLRVRKEDNSARRCHAAIVHDWRNAKEDETLFE